MFGPLNPNTIVPLSTGEFAMPGFNKADSRKMMNVLLKIKILIICRAFSFACLIFASASLIRPAPVKLPQDRKVARVDG